MKHLDSGIDTESHISNVSKDEHLAAKSTQPEVMSLEASEFISFAMYRLWNPKSMPKQSPPIIPLEYQGENKPQLPAPYSQIISPSGTEEWYPYFVLRVHKVLSRVALPTPLIFIALLYIARLRQNIPPDVATGSEFKLLLAALIVSQKQHSDSRYANSVWAKVSGYTVEAVNKLEKDFLLGMKWHLHVKGEQYDKWVTTMQTLGKEHSLVLKAFSMSEEELANLELKLQSRPDLINEIRNLRKLK